MNMQQLNSLLADTDHEFGPQVVDNQWWQSLCKDKGVDPSRGVSKQHLLSFYFANPESSVKRDYIRIFIEGAANRLNAEEADMFEKIWAKYSQGGDSMNLQQLNLLLADTDHEFGPQVVSDEWWQSLCSERGVDPSKGVSKHHLLGFYIDNPPSSIKRDYARIFVEEAQLQQTDKEPSLLNRLDVEEAGMFEKIWAKYSQDGHSMNLQQLNSLLADTDHEFGPQVVDNQWWQSLCKDKGVDPSRGVSKQHLLSFYFANPESSIKRDYIRIFIEE